MANFEDPLADTLDTTDPQQPQQPAPAPPVHVDMKPAPKPTTEPDIFEQEFQARQAARTIDLRKSIHNADLATPEQAAEAQRLSDRTGIPAPIVLRNLDDVRNRVQRADAPVGDMLEQSPATSAFISDPTQRARTAAVKDDLEQLGFLEWLTKAPQRAWTLAQAQHVSSTLHYESMFRALTPAEQTQLEQAQKDEQQAGKLGAGQSWFRGAIVAGVEALPDLFGMTLAGAKYAIPAGVTAGTAAALYDVAGPQVALAEYSVPITVPIAFGAGASAGETVGAAQYIFPLEAGRAYSEYSGYRDELGQQLDPTVARAAALATGAINSGLQTIGLGYFLKAIPGLSKLGGAGTRAAMKTALRNPTIRSALFNAVKGYGTTLTAQTAIQVADKAVTILGGELAKVAGVAPVPGQTAAGNVDLFQQPRVQNPDGSVSTVDSVSVNLDGKEILLPRVTPDGRHLSTDEAIAEYKATGRNLGTFDSPTTATAFAEKIHQDYAAGKFDTAGSTMKHKTPEEVAHDLGEATLSAIQGLALINAPGAMIHFGSDAYKARRASQNVAFFTALGQGAAQSKTIERLPNAAQEFIRSATKDGPIADVYAPIETFTSYWQSKGVDPAEMATELTGSKDAYAHALASGEDLKIPTENYAVKLAGTEHNGFFARELRLAPDEMNAREAEAFKAQQKRAAEAAKPETSPAASVGADITEQLHRAGFERSTAESYGKLYEQAFATLGVRAGLDPVSLFRRYGLNIKRAVLDTPGADRPAAGERPAVPLPEVPAAEPGALEGLRGELAGLGLVPAEGADTTAGRGSAASLEAPLEAPGTKPLPEVPPPGPGAAAAVADLRGTLAEDGRQTVKDFKTHIAEMKATRAAWAKQVEDEFAASGIVHTVGANGISHIVHESTYPGHEGEYQVTTLRDGEPVSHFNVKSVSDAAKELINEKIQTRADRAGNTEAQTGGPRAADRAGAGLSNARGEPVAGAAGGAPDAAGVGSGAREGRTVAVPAKYETHFNDLLAGAREHGFAGSDDSLAEQFNAKLEEAHQVARDLAPDDILVSVHHDLLKFIADAGGLGINAEGEAGMRGELEHLLESLQKTTKSKGVIKRGKRAGQEVAVPKAFRRSGGVSGIAGIVKRDGGQTVDHILEAVNEDGRFGEVSSLADLLVKIEDAVRVETGQSAAEPTGFDFHGILEGALHVTRDEPWWSNGTDIVAQPGEAVEPDVAGEGSTSFNVREFDQGLFDKLDEDPNVDILSTGEKQPRLPGDVGAVRNQEQAQPALGEVPFSLTAPTEKAGRAKKLRDYEPSAEYKADLETFRQASQDYTEATKAYRAQTIGDAEFLAARAKFEDAKQANDAAIAREDAREKAYFGTKRSLFQGEAPGPLTMNDVRDWAMGVQEAAGPDVKEFTVYLHNGELRLGTLHIDLGAQRAGLGTAIMKELTAFADAHNVRISLTPADRNSAWGTTSRARLVKFYKRFGFVENTGRNYEPSTGPMYREPSINARTTEFGQPAYHGSPHDFERFSLEHVGKGEGAAAYGWGLYFAENPDVAAEYRRRLAGPDKSKHLAFNAPDEASIESGDIFKPGGLLHNDPEDPRNAPYKLTGEETRGLYELSARAHFAPAGPKGIEQLRSDLAKTLENYDKLRERNAEHGTNETMSGDEGVDRFHEADARAAAAVLARFGDKLEIRPAQKPGRTYQVDIPDPEVAKFLDWDASVNEQPPAVKAALERAGLTGKSKEGWKWEAHQITAADVAAGSYGPGPREGDWITGLYSDGKLQAHSGVTFSFEYAAKQNADYRNEHRVGSSGGGEQIYRDLETKLGSDKAASEALRKAGIPGLKYFDGNSRSKGEGTRNLVVFDDSIVKLTHKDGKPFTAAERKEYFQSEQADKPDLIVTHNLTAANLEHATALGGIPVPALSIMKAGEAQTGFGEITLLGHKDLANPQKGAKVFGADAYSPRYPTVHFKIDRAGERVLSDALKPYTEITGDKFFDLDSVQKEGARGLRSDTRVMAAFLDSEGKLDRQEVEAAATSERDPYYRKMDIRNVLRNAIEKNNLDRAFEKYSEKLFASMKPESRIFKGFTDAGNRSYKPHTLENVVAELKKNIRGGESDANIYGMGQLRSHVTPMFKSVAAIKKAAGRLVSDADFEHVKAEVEKSFFDISDALKSSYDHGDADRLGFSDTVMAVMADSRKKGLEGALKEYGFSDVSTETKQSIVKFLEQLRNMPTEYFEAKHLRAVQPSEFTAAIVPHNAAPETIATLERSGLRVEKYQAGVKADRQAVIERTARALAETSMFAGAKDARRGVIRFGPDRQFNIDLLERADLSTFLHETGHFYLEVFSDVVDGISQIDEAARTPEQQQLVADWKTLLKDFGVENTDQIEESHHEQFARTFEAWLMEGKAPSEELRPVFARFRAWLVGIYQSVKNLHVNLTPEVRRVLERMVAGDKAIADAEAQGNVAPMFTTPESAGMSPAEFSLYSKTVADASTQAREKLETQLLTEVQRERTAQWKAERDKLETEITARVGEQPVYQAMAAILRGTNPDGTPLVEGMEAQPMKLSRAILAEKFGADRIKRLPRGMVTREGGLDPDAVAEHFGFSSGDEMLTALEKAGPLKAVVEKEVTQRMLAEHGSMLLDGSLHEKAQAAVANTGRENVVKAELRALAALRRTVQPFERAAAGRTKTEQQAERAYERRWLEAEAKLRIAIAEGHKQLEIDALQQDVNELKAKARGGAATINAAIPPDGVLRQVAGDRVGAMKIHELQGQVFWSAARRASKDATDKAARQDLEGAIVAKQQELINLHMYRTVMDAREDVDTRVRGARDLATKNTLRAAIGKAGESFLEQIDGILERYDFAPRTRKQQAERASLRKWAAAMEGEGLPVDLSDELLDDIRRVPFTELTYDELVGVTDGIREIAHLARLKNRLLKQEAARELSEVTEALAGSIRENSSPRKDGKVVRDRNATSEKFRLIDSFFASHRKLASLAREMDGYKDGGLMWEHVIRPLNEAADVEADMMAKATAALGGLVEEAFPGAEKRHLYDRTNEPTVGRSLSRLERIMIALNWGNDGNRQRIKSSEKWSDAQVEAVLDPLTAKDWKFVQGVWDLLETYRPEIGAKQKRVTGLEPTWVDPVPVETKYGTQRGGYFPLKYDDRLSAQAGAHLDMEGANIQKAAAYVKNTTKKGHTIERLSRVTLPVRYDFGVITEHLQQVIHDLSHHETLIDVQRVLADRNVQKAIYDRFGDLTYKQFKDGLRDIAAGGTPGGQVGPMDKGLNYLRSGASISTLGWNLGTTLFQPVGLTQSMMRIGTKWVTKGITRWLRDARHMENTVGWISDKSLFMKNRARTQNREIAEIRNRVVDGTGKLSGWVDSALRGVTADHVTKADIADSYFWMIGQAQRLADVPTWLGQYEKSMAAGESEARAISLADQAVIDSQSSGHIKDLALVQRGSPALKVWTMFYSIFSATHNLTMESIGQARRAGFTPKSIGRLAGDMLLLYTLPATLSIGIRAAMGQNVGDLTDAKKAAAALIREQASYLLNTIVLAREFSGVVQGYDYQGPAGARAFVAISKAAKQVTQGEGDAAFFRSLNDVAGVLFQYPSTQVWRTLEGIAAMSEGKTKNPAAVVTGYREQK